MHRGKGPKTQSDIRPLTRPSDTLPPWRGKGIVMIAHKVPMDGLNIEEVGGQRERPERPKAHSLGQRPRYKVVSIFAL